MEPDEQFDEKILSIIAEAAPNKVSKSRHGCSSPESRKIFSAAIFSAARVAQTGSLRGFRIIIIRRN